MLMIRDVNSWEIAFPGREAQFPGLDQDSRFRPSTAYLFPVLLGLGGRWRREGGGGAIAGRSRTLLLADAGTRSID